MPERGQFLQNRILRYVENNRKDPEDAARLVEKLILRKNPPLRNIPDLEARLLYLLRKILPFRAYSCLIRKGLFTGLDAAGK